MNPRLIAISGPMKGSVFPLTGEPLTIGRTADNDICLDDELVGRHHASLWLNEGKPYLRNGDSRNGTWVDGSAYIEKFLEHVRPAEVTAKCSRLRRHRRMLREATLSIPSSVLSFCSDFNPLNPRNPWLIQIPEPEFAEDRNMARMF